MNERVLNGTAAGDKPAAATAGAWRGALATLLVVLVAIVVLYRETALAMVDIWTRSETFAHGFLVPPISVWLIWRLRASLARLTPRASGWTLPALAAAGLLWFLGELAAVSVVTQFALTAMLVLAVPVVLGWAVAGRIVFPLAFLFFAVPFGEFALPQLMEWTASFTVLGLRLSGIPVYREGLQFVIPSGSWSVIEACSGVRYLIASLCVGTLFAYLTYQSYGRRLLFIAVSFVVPVFANWLRAYMIVMLGHLSNNRLANGVDHLIYGWVFFGVVIGIMFWIGSRWREDAPDDAQPAAATALAMPGARRPALPGAALAALATVAVTAFWPAALWQIENHLPPPVDRLEALAPAPGWPEYGDGDAAIDWTPRYENPSARLQQTFGSPQRAVGVYLGYYRNQESGRKLVTSGNVLVTSGDRSWSRVGGGSRSIEVAQRDLVVRRSELRSSGPLRLVVWQWYWVNGRLTASDFVAKAYTVFSRLTGQGDDAAVIVVYTPLAGDGSDGSDDAALQDYVDAAWPQIEAVLAGARNRR